MMEVTVLYLEGFYGQTVEVMEDRLYDGAEELWLHEVDGVVRVGVTKVGVLLMGGIDTTEFFVEEGDRLERGDDLVFFETFKSVRYVVSPLAGEVISVNRLVIDEPELFDDDPYGEAWLLELRPDDGEDLAARYLAPELYLQALARSEHCAEGAEVLLEAKKGSPTCRAVYGGIRGNDPGEGSLGRNGSAGGPAEAATEAAPDGSTDSVADGSGMRTLGTGDTMDSGTPETKGRVDG
jgi:glycine cleavage system H protein